MIEGYKGLTTWQKAYQLSLEVYKITADFPKQEQFSLTSQMRRAAISVPANIAEGYERQHRKEYLQFLRISKGSLAELETYLLLGKDLGYITHEASSKINSQLSEVAKLLNGLVRSLAV